LASNPYRMALNRLQVVTAPQFVIPSASQGSHLSTLITPKEIR
jgi:hypothetical protein